ncbi:hypothetical protein MNV49_006184 [Pseudohyphozyma bogoriensis]|nr:hypothetical protein MNV49_006184 [Pseudohyphozyma bogoriensis]
MASQPPPDASILPDLEELPASEDDIAFWRNLGGNGEDDKWDRLTDEKSTADKWGLKEAEEVGVSFKSGGSFPKPTVVRPVDPEEEEEQ